MDTEWCVATVDMAIEKHGTPEIINSDQGSQFTSDQYIQNLQNPSFNISMDGKGRATDNIFVERLWRSLKYEGVYPRAYEDGLQLFQGLKTYFNFYNLERRHSSIGDKFPPELYNAA